MRKSGSAPTVSPTGNGGLPVLNYSQLSEWNKCRYRYGLSTMRHIQSRAVLRALDMGSAGHAGMEAAVRTMAEMKTKTRESAVERNTQLGQAIDKAVLKWSVEQVELRGGKGQMTEEELLELDQIMAEAPQIVRRAVAYLNPLRWRTLKLRKYWACEMPIQIKFPGWAGFHGTLDWVAEDLEEGGVWIFDYKFRREFTAPEAEEVNLQMAIYQHLLKAKFGIESTGTIMLQVRSRVPAQPELNKNGTMSRARVATDWATYAKALKSAGLRVEDYQDDMRSKLDYEFYRMTPQYRSPEEVESIWRNVVRTEANVLLNDRGRLRRLYRNMSYLNCSGCWAREFCQAELRSEDTDFLLKTRYIDLDNPQERLILAPEDLIIED